MKKLIVAIKGGPSSGNYGHAGRPGLVGGSGGSGGGVVGRHLDLAGNDKAGRRNLLQNLQPNATMTVFHGMRYMDEVLKTIQDGFDPSGEYERGRIYGGRELEFEGYHVSPDLKVSSGFGPFVFEFDVAAKDMIAPPGTHWDIPTAAGADEFWRSSYPDSFRPSLTQSLLLAESQGLLTNSVPTANIKAVWMYDGDWQSHTPASIVQKIADGIIR